MRASRCTRQFRDVTANIDEFRFVGKEREHATEAPITVTSPGLPSEESTNPGLPSNHQTVEVLNPETIRQRAAEAVDVIQRMTRVAAAGDEDIRGDHVRMERKRLAAEKEGQASGLPSDQGREGDRAFGDRMADGFLERELKIDISAPHSFPID